MRATLHCTNDSLRNLKEQRMKKQQEIKKDGSSLVVAFCQKYEERVGKTFEKWNKWSAFLIKKNQNDTIGHISP